MDKEVITLIQRCNKCQRYDHADKSCNKNCKTSNNAYCENNSGTCICCTCSPIHASIVAHTTEGSMQHKIFSTSDSSSLMYKNLYQGERLKLNDQNYHYHQIRH